MSGGWWLPALGKIMGKFCQIVKNNFPILTKNTRFGE